MAFDSGSSVQHVLAVDGTSHTLKSFLAALMVIAIVLLALLAVLYWVFSQTRPRKFEKRKRKTIAQHVWTVVVLVVVLVVGTILSILGLGVVHAVERKKLFAPTRISHYRKISGLWQPLPSGGGLMQLTPDIDPAARPVLFIHGNSGHLDMYAEALWRFSSLGYNVYCLEMAGYGPTVGPPGGGGPSAKSVVQDAREAWAICGRSDALLVGFSLGGGIVGQIYDELDPLPAQLVFLNTMASIPALVSEKAGSVLGPLVTPLIETQWETQPPKRFTGRVVVVWSADDTIVPAEHGAEICAIFTRAGLKPECVELPNGSHRTSALSYLSSWCNTEILLPS